MNAILDRASPAYREGYKDGEANRPARNNFEYGSFAAYEYDLGHNAGFSATYWAAMRENADRDRRAQRAAYGLPAL